MTQERGNFRGRLFGGFNRKDVINYIEALAEERNKLAQENAQLKEQMEAIAESQQASEISEGGNGNRDIQEKSEYVKVEPSANYGGAAAEIRETVLQMRNSIEAFQRDIRINVINAQSEIADITAKFTEILGAVESVEERLESLDREFIDIGEQSEKGGTEVAKIIRRTGKRNKKSRS